MIIAYHGKNGLPKILKNQPVDVIENSAKYLLNNGYKQIGVWGISMGGCLALLAGSLMPELISCIVSIAPLQMVMQAEKAKTPVEGSSFSFHGTELPFVRYVPQGKAWKQEMKKAMWKQSSIGSASYRTSIRGMPLYADMRNEMPSTPLSREVRQIL